MGTGLPITTVTFHVMIAAKRVTSMISNAAVLRIGKHDIVIFIITDPSAATLGFC
jgi:hypothetical protein